GLTARQLAHRPRQEIPRGYEGRRQVGHDQGVEPKLVGHEQGHQEDADGQQHCRRRAGDAPPRSEQGVCRTLHYAGLPYTGGLTGRIPFRGGPGASTVPPQQGAVQARGPQGQGDDDDGQGQDVNQGRAQVEPYQGTDDPQRQARHQGAVDVAHAAHDDHRQADDHGHAAHGAVDGQQGSHQAAGHGGQGPGAAEGQHVQPPHVDADGLGHFGVVGRKAEGAPAAGLEKDKQETHEQQGYQAHVGVLQVDPDAPHPDDGQRGPQVVVERAPNNNEDAFHQHTQAQ